MELFDDLIDGAEQHVRSVSMVSTGFLTIAAMRSATDRRSSVNSMCCTQRVELRKFGSFCGRLPHDRDFGVDLVVGPFRVVGLAVGASPPKAGKPTMSAYVTAERRTRSPLPPTSTRPPLRTSDGLQPVVDPRRRDGLAIEEARGRNRFFESSTRVEADRQCRSLVLRRWPAPTPSSRRPSLASRVAASRARTATKSLLRTSVPTQGRRRLGDRRQCG